MMLASSIVILAFCWSSYLCHGANIELANMWLHHEMAPWELNRHFGVEASNQVRPEMYQVIKIQTHNDESDGGNKSKRAQDQEMTISFLAFGQHRRIQLVKNRKLLSADAKVFFTDGAQKLPLELPSNTDCHFLHNSDSMSAAMSNCQGQTYEGHVIDEGSIFEINPLHQRFNDLLMTSEEAEQELTWHIITRRPIHQLPDFGAELNATREKTDGSSKIQFASSLEANHDVVKRASGDLTIETAVFLDPAAYRYNSSSSCHFLFEFE